MLRKGFCAWLTEVASWGSCIAPCPWSVSLGLARVPSAAAIALFSPAEQRDLVGRLSDKQLR